jgi:excisionase family DNA binding protein
VFTVTYLPLFGLPSGKVAVEATAKMKRHPRSEMVTVQEAAALLGVRRERVWQLIKRGALTATKSQLDGRYRLIPRTQIDQMLRYEGAVVASRNQRRVAKNSLEKLSTEGSELKQ